MNHKKTIITIFILSLIVFCSSLTMVYGTPEFFDDDVKTALVLNAAESKYGSKHCEKIIDMLEDLGYEVTYLADEAVSLSFVRYNLTADVIYYNTIK